MNLLELISTNPDLATLRGLALILTPELQSTLVDVQEQLGPRQHQVATVLLTDGRFMLGADLLTEIGETGLYSAGFGQLPPEVLPLVDVMPMAEALALRPESEPMEFGE
jgi:hypothetical protein